MMMDTAELKGAALNWAVAMCEGYTDLRKNPHRHDDAFIMTPPRANYGPVYLHDLPYATSWEHGGEIIGREFICLNGDDGAPGVGASWDASIFDDGETSVSGPTALIAAMRCYVAVKLGEVVEVPNELLRCADESCREYRTMAGGCPVCDSPCL